MNLVYLSNIQFLSLYGDRRERKHANKILTAYFKSLTLKRKVDNEALSDYIKQGLPMTNYMTCGSKEAKQLMRDIRRTRAKNSLVKGLNKAQANINQFFVDSVGVLVFGTFLVIFSAITLLLVPVISLN